MFYRITEDTIVSTKDIRYVEFYDSGHGSVAMRYEIKIVYMNNTTDYHHLYANSKEDARTKFKAFCDFLEKKEEE